MRGHRGGVTSPSLNKTAAASLFAATSQKKIPLEAPFLSLPGGARESRRAEHNREGDKGGGEHSELTLAPPVRSRRDGAAGPRLHPLCDPGGSEQLQGVGPVSDAGWFVWLHFQCAAWILTPIFCLQV